jgi:N-acetylglutamate synthase-like GNAT family acetyltransferase
LIDFETLRPERELNTLQERGFCEGRMMATEAISALEAYVPARAFPLSTGVVIGTFDGFVLRHARDDDAERIIELISAVWREYPGKTLVAANDMPELLRPASAYAECDGRFWILEAHGEIIGTVALAPSAEPGVVELQKLYVARDMRKNGLGSFLCQLVEHEARERGAHAVELWSDIKLLDAHHRYERLGYQRSELLKAYNDTSSTVRYHYRKPLEPDRPATGAESINLRERVAAPSRPRRLAAWLEEIGNLNKLSFTAHPASVGENYFQHLRHAAAFAGSMISGGLAVLVHAVLPFLFTKTGSGIIATLHTRMVTDRHNFGAKRPPRRPRVAGTAKRAPAASPARPQAAA